ncbi:MAG: hypothetical protein HY966_08100 [Ignavibacteriales bacterium]|nr:hypothetical protein [Ignavibacteriales bacterium]
MEHQLRLLFALQNIDNGLDELHELKGDLPQIVSELTEKAQTLRRRKAELEETSKHSIVQRNEADGEIVALKEKIEKYKTQQFQVKTNKQYDMLTREIDMTQGRVAKLTKELEILEGTAITAKTDAEALAPEIELAETELSERQTELDTVNKEHEEEELRLRHEREKVAVRIVKSDLAAYEKIRRAKDGKAVVPVKRNACGGCFNRVPPQKVLELRKLNAMLTCERCGRILVPDEIVHNTTALE